MYCLTIRKTRKAFNALQACLQAYGFIVDYNYKSIWKIYGFDCAEIAVIKDCLKVKKEEHING